MMEAITTGTAVATSGEQHKWRPNRNTSLYGATRRSMEHHVALWGIMGLTRQALIIIGVECQPIWLHRPPTHHYPTRPFCKGRWSLSTSCVIVRGCHGIMQSWLHALSLQGNPTPTHSVSGSPVHRHNISFRHSLALFIAGKMIPTGCMVDVHFMIKNQHRLV